jgi:hypothetical protein
MKPKKLAPNSPFFCDTSIIYYKLHSHSLQREAVQRIRGSHRLVLSTFVRGEYIKGYIYGLIVLYTTIKAEGDVEDGIHVFLQTAAIAIGASRMLLQARHSGYKAMMAPTTYNRRSTDLATRSNEA